MTQIYVADYLKQILFRIILNNNTIYNMVRTPLGETEVWFKCSLRFFSLKISASEFGGNFLFMA